MTIFGGSAGGMCVALLMLSPLASGLYKNVIMQSGTAAAISSAKERNEADLRARCKSLLHQTPGFSNWFLRET